jgi:Mg-chelatase subunit ChlD
MGRRREDGTTRWTEARAELARALDDLAGARVNVLCFREDVAAAFPAAAPLTRRRRAHLDAWLDEVVPGGRTALYDGVAAALADPDLDTLVVLSDGAPSAGRHFTKTDLLAELTARNRWRRARIHVVSIGGDQVAARWRGVLRRLAEASGGTYVAR